MKNLEVMYSSKSDEWSTPQELFNQFLVVMLIPSRTDTRYFHNFIYGRTEIRFVKGRLKFGDSINSAPFPSMIVIFRGPKV